MNAADRQPSCVVLGEQSLLVQCAELLLQRGFRILTVVTADPRISAWCAQNNILVTAALERLPDALGQTEFDYLFSITNLRMLPRDLLRRASKMAINFHDGPLPRYAGLNAPVWALMAGETEYGVTWHVIEEGADTGAVLVSRKFAIEADDTVFSLNARCYENGLASFSDLIAALLAGNLLAQPQDLSRRSYFGLATRPANEAILDLSKPVAELIRWVRALDFGPYPNPLALPKLLLGRQLVLVRDAEREPAASGIQTGAVQAASARSLTVRAAGGAIRFNRVTDSRGDPIDVQQLLQSEGLKIGSLLTRVAPGEISRLEGPLRQASRHEGFWRRALSDLEPLEPPMALPASGSAGVAWRSAVLQPSSGDAHAVTQAELLTALLLLLFRLADKSRGTVAVTTFADHGQTLLGPALLANWLPLSLRFDPGKPVADLARQVGEFVQIAANHGAYHRDLLARTPQLRDQTAVENLPIRIFLAPRWSEEAARAVSSGTGLELFVADQSPAVAMFADSDRLLDAYRVLLAGVRAHPAAIASQVNLLPASERSQLLAWAAPRSAAGPPGGAEQRIHRRFEAQVARSPDRIACIDGGESVSYADFNARANRLARYLQRLGTQRGDLVGVMIERSIGMLVALYAVHKCGAAYVPLDPEYPRDRLEHMIADSGARLVITTKSRANNVAAAQPLAIDALPAEAGQLDAGNLDVAVEPSDLAYVIYTSGSTGSPKGVVVEHRNVANFFEGMNECIGSAVGTWLAVTSISFDISVLELFWTLSNGFTVVLNTDGTRKPAAARAMEFSLFYWNVAKNEADYDAEKYRLLLEGAKFADANGFVAVWNPERHFEAFGGLFPNPSVTCAALATITKNVQLRAGSCVVPLHSPIRIAEEWAVVDNLSNGRVGLSIAAGWAPPDFAIKPENFANAKQVMFDSAATLRKLWRGETVPFPGPSGEVKVRTLPRPIQKELPLWMTTAGNIDSFVQAGTLGYNLLTHLLGQSVDEVAKKVAAYRAAWRDAGHAGQGTVSLMLHTLVGPDADAVERVVRQPLKEYLKSAMFLVKAAAWQFPTFKKMSDEQGKTLDQFFATISGEDMDGLLEFSFQRYFKTSGLFGTLDQCRAMVERVTAAGVDEIACLIDFGIQTDLVLEHLPYLNTLRKDIQQQRVASAAAATPIHELIAAHKVSHFQCTPSMATMLAGDPVAQPALRSLKHMMVGGEAFPPELARNLRRLVGGRLTNMYGPTETTIWSTVGDVSDAASPANNVSIGRPLPNQCAYILDQQQQLLPAGVAGELVIGGAGVSRGYWRRPELTSMRFLPDPFAAAPGARMYRTGDRARFLPDGRIECLGRVDLQVKIRGYRVELGEIEARLRDCASVAEAAVVLREDVPGDKRLIAYVRTADGRPLDANALKGKLRESLPDFMVPASFIALAALPLTPNGKVDRKALPAPGAFVAKSTAVTAPIKGDTEQLVIKIWQRVLAHSDFGTRDNFFDIGGHSLLVVQVLKELRDTTGKTIQMTDLFKYTTVEALARFLAGPPGPIAAATDRGTARADARRAALERRRKH